MKKLFVFIVCIVLLSAFTVCAAAADSVELMENTEVMTAEVPKTYAAVYAHSEPLWDTDDRCYKDRLSGSALAAYEKLESAFSGDSIPPLIDGYWQMGTAMEKEWTGGISMSAYNDWLNAQFNDMFMGLRGFCYDNPGLFYIDAGIKFSHSYSYLDDTVYGARLGFAIKAAADWDTPEEAAAIGELENGIYDVVETIVAATEGMPTVAKLAYFDNWLAAENEYNQKALESLNNYPSDVPWCVVSGLLDNDEPVCEGYAKSFQLLCHRIGVPCITLSGYADGEGHMWTAVMLGDEWYFCDPTWDDPIYLATNKTENYSSREYFLSAWPASHVLEGDALFGVPELSEKGYFDSWKLSDGGVSGGELSNGRLVVALYDEDGRMLECAFGYPIVWNKWQTMLLCPEFKTEDLERADHAARFVFDSTGRIVLSNKLEF